MTVAAPRTIRIGLAIWALGLFLTAAAGPALAEDATPSVKPALPKPAVFGPHPQPAAVPGIAEPISRNAIGAPVAAQGAGLAKPGNSPVHSVAPAAAAAPNSGKIAGSAFVRPATAPAALGGPARPVAVINGSTIRPKH